MSKNIKIGNDVLQDVDTIKFEDAENPGQFVEFLDTTDANAVAGEILNGKTGYVNGTKITGTIPSKAAQTYTPTTTDQTIASGQYLSGTQTVLGDANLVAGNIKKDVSIFGITGTHEGGVTPTGNINITTTSQVDVTNYATAQVVDADLIASNIKKDVNILGVVGSYEGGGGGGDALSITANVTNGSWSGATYTYEDDTGVVVTATGTITPSTNYVLPTSVSVSGASFVYNNSTGVITLTNATGNVTITATCLAQYTITGNITNGSLSGASTILQNSTAVVNIVGDDGYSAPEDSSGITVTNATLVSYAAGALTIGNPTGNVTVTATCVEDMAKGTILNIDMTGSGTAQQYRVVKLVTSDVVEVFSMADVNTSIQFDSGNTNTYEGKTLDTYLNTTWYDTLSTTAKNALVAKTFKQDSWYSGASGYPDYQGKYSGDTAYQVSLGNASYGNEITRNVYALSVQDIIDYLGVTPEMAQSNTTLTYNNVWQMFWNSTTTHSGNLWIRSAYASFSSNAFSVNGTNGIVDYDIAFSSFRARAAFQIDLSKIEWSK